LSVYVKKNEKDLLEKKVEIEGIQWCGISEIGEISRR
jgi:hypothetical protein